ncbi:MAG: sulfotransferase [Deltaproteobacteria bacterium]|nr:MAG: sulfotransferase [Deltaproteobacteria bacterium]
MSGRRRYLRTLRWLATEAEPGPARRAALLTLAALPPLVGAVRLGRTVDDWRFPDLASDRVVAPVFVVGMPRSGTTYLHRLLARDEDRFRTTALWQHLLPSVTLQRAAARWWALEPRFGPVHRFREAVERGVFDRVDPHHAIGWTLPEEEAFTLAHHFGTPHAELLAASDINGEWWVPDTLPASERDRWMDFYAGSLRRQQHQDGRARTSLGKSPNFLGWMASLHARFPDARFILALRAPEESLASYIHAEAQVWSLLTGERRPPVEVVRASVEGQLSLLEHAGRVWQTLPENQRVLVPYRALMRDPKAVITSLYAHFGWEPGPVSAQLESAPVRIPRAIPPLRHYGIAQRALGRRIRSLPPPFGRA